MIVAMSHEPTKSQGEDDQHIAVNDDAQIARWAHRLCTSPENLRQAIAAVGPLLRDVKRYLFAALLRDTHRRRDKDP
jgi:hypothetical protein